MPENWLFNVVSYRIPLLPKSGTVEEMVIGG
jgi:hypothetical protein